MIKIGILVVAGALLAAVIVCQPMWLSQNEFLSGFANHEVLALFAVIVTVTLASVANIHLALNRLVQRRFGNDGDLKTAAQSVKSQINDDAWYIFWGFVITVGLLVLKGAFPNHDHVVAFVHGAVLWTLMLNLACMYDIYKVVFGIVELELEVGGATGPGEDHSS